MRADIKSILLAAQTLFSLFLHHIHRGNCTYVRGCVHNAQPCIHEDFQAYTNCKLHGGYTLAHKIPLYVSSHSMHAWIESSNHHFYIKQSLLEAHDCLPMLNTHLQSLLIPYSSLKWRPSFFKATGERGLVPSLLWAFCTAMKLG